MEVNQDTLQHRLYIGGLFNDIATKEIRERFESFGQVGNIQVIQRKDENGKIMKTFCYMDIISTPSKINKCISLYSKSKWKGSEIKVQVAKENYLTRLEREWKSREEKEIESLNISKSPCKNYQEIKSKVSKMKAVVPGTRISDEPNWIIGKYGRPLPIVRLRHRNSKLIKFDPSKHCHQLKKITGDYDEEENRFIDLSWSLVDGNEDTGEKGEKGKMKKAKVKECTVNKKESSVSHGNGKDAKREIKTNVKRLRDHDSTGESDMNAKVDAHMIFNANDKSQIKEIDNVIVLKKGYNKGSSLSNSIDPELNKSEDKVQMGQALNEPTAVSQRGSNTKLGGLGSSLNFMNLVNKFTNFSSKGVKISDIVFDEEDILEGTEISSDSELGQAMGQETTNEIIKDSHSLGENIVSQIARKRKRSSIDDEDLAFQYDLGNGSGKNLLRKEEPFTNQNPRAEDNSSNSEDSSEDNYRRSGSEESNSESDEDDGEEKLSGKDCETSVDEKGPLNIEENSSDNGSVTMVQSKKSKSDDLVENFETNTYHSLAWENENSSSEDDEVSLDHLHSVHDIEAMKDEEVIEERKKVLSNIKVIGAQSSSKISILKKKLSEEKRLESLSERKKTELSERNLVSLALKSENLQSEDSRHLRFESSGEETDDTNNSNMEITNKKITGTTALSWLGLEDSDDPNDEDSNRFEIKKQFEGSKGEELFKLHKKAALDERFKIDSRFFNSESDDQNSVVDEEDQVDDVNYELVKEKSKALSILDDLLGKRSKAVQKTTITQEKIINDIVRYDPLDDLHAKYENVEEHIESETEELELPTKDQKAGDKAYPEVAKESYYDVSCNLKGLFKKPETQTFTFLNDDDDNSNSKTLHTFLGETTTLEKKRSDPSFKKFDDESDYEDFGSDDEKHTKMDTEIEKSARSTDELFFFTEDDPRLRSGSDDYASDFMRKEPINELYQQLEAKREKLRQDFKRKHKDAVRRQRKKQAVKGKMQN